MLHGIEVTRFSPEEWHGFSADAHRICFGEIKDPAIERVDFAISGVKDGRPVGFATAKEMDSGWVYLQYGGAFPGTLQTSLSFKAYQVLIGYCKERYKYISTFIENSNLVMLKMAMKVGFRITGVRVAHGKVMLEHTMEVA